MDTIEEFLRELRQVPATTWVADEIDETLSQGVSMNVKDAAADSGFFELLPFQNVPAKERNKRLTYETSRPFTEEEKIQVILKAIEVMYLDLPAIRNSALNNLKAFGDIDSIVFSSADEEFTKQEMVHQINITEVSQELDKYRELHSRFASELGR